jgi:hypothetical protein
MTKKAKPQEKNFSKILAEERNLAIALTQNTGVRIRYDAKMESSAFNMETDEITLSLTPYPDYVQTNPIIFRKVLDGDLAHECGHLIMTKPLWSYFNNWTTKIKRKRGFYKLAHEICNLVEDKRINHMIILRYRFDIGKRLLLANLILKDMIDNTIEKKIVSRGNFTNLEGETASAPQEIKMGENEGVYIVAILCNQGLYEAKCTEFWNKLSSQAKTDCELALKTLENVKYKRMRIDIIRSCQEIYDLIAKHLKADYTSKQYLVSKRGGKIKGDISPELKAKLEAEAQKQAKEEKEKDEHLKDLQRGSGAGEGTGNEIPAPSPDFAHYSELLDACKPEITELLNLLKKKLKPRCQRQIFQKRGKMMSPIVPRIYTNSFKGVVRNVYMNVQTKFEKEQVAIQFLFDFSASVDKEQAEKITTILNEVFGHYVDDMGFSIGCFGADSQKIKTFFESFDNTKARVGNIGVSPSGTEVSVLLEASLRMFNTIKGERRKMLVIASDFCFGDEQRAHDLIEQYARSGIECMFIGFCGCENVETFANDIPKLKVKRTAIKQISDLPSAFLSVYLGVQT